MKIKKAKIIHGLGIIFRDVEPTDAEFILTLRTNNTKNKFISPVSPDLSLQIAYLEEYKTKEKEAYFIIESDGIGPVGTVRIYDQQGDSFCWGSWIISSSAPVRTAFKSAALVYAYAFDNLGFNSAHFDVRQKNLSVWRFHERFGAELTKEDELDRFYTLPRSKWEAIKPNYLQFLPSPPLHIDYL